ncbi:primosomal protein N' [Patescibacteria group bacterium]
MPKFAEICLKRRMPNSLRTLTYEIPEDFKVSEGSYVNVPLRNKSEEGVVLNILDKKPSYPTKNINELIYDYPILQKWQIELAKWMSNYYFAPIQKCLNLFLPPKFYKSEDIKQAESKKIEKKHELTNAQKAAIEKILKTSKKFTLLHGITGSGKTEVYVNLVEEYIAKGKQCLLIVPEISLTPQMIQYFERIFGDNTAILHSRLTPKQRSLEWLKIFLNKTPIIIGPRSAVFAPLTNPGLIILDEEHEFSYKQEQAPRYHTLKVIEKITELTDVKVVLGTATPSISTYHKAINGDYELAELNERIGGANLPEVKIVDLREEFMKKNYSILSEDLQEKITETLAAKKQAILFLNKRGAASAIVCRECGYMEKCSACDVPMTYHKSMPSENKFKPILICHHCGLMKDVLIKCPECQCVSIKFVGSGTQKVEEEVRAMFPEARVARVDKDTVSKRGSFDEIYEKLKNREIDILIGTQMIGKGLHFPNVNLVGVILADIGLHFPDFRSSERTFQLLTQVAGRAGRAETEGEVIIQTYMPENYAIKYSKDHNFKDFYEYEIDQRRTFSYPPFGNLVKLTFVDEKAKKSMIDAKNVYEKLKKSAPESIQINLYPSLIYKLHNKYRWNVLLQGENLTDLIKNLELPSSCRIDVDPISIS